jgi:hypothetical protein
MLNIAWPGSAHFFGGRSRSVTASARRAERPGALRPTIEKFSNSPRPPPPGVGRQFSTWSSTSLAQASGPKRDPSRPRRVPRLAPASPPAHPLVPPSLAALGSAIGGSRVARVDRELAPCPFTSPPLLVSSVSAVEKAPCPPPLLDSAAASVHRLSTVKLKPPRPQGSGTASARPRPSEHHRVVSAGVSKPPNGAPRRPPLTGARRPTLTELLGARKHSSAVRGPRAAVPPGQGRTLLLGPRAFSRPPDEPVPLLAPPPRRKGKRKRDEPETNAERSAATQRQQVEALVAETPMVVLDRALGGPSAAAQVPDPAVREALQRQLLTSRGGPIGDLLHKALRSWHLLTAAACQQPPPRPWPASHRRPSGPGGRGRLRSSLVRTPRRAMRTRTRFPARRRAIGGRASPWRAAVCPFTTPVAQAVGGRGGPS